MAEPEDITLTGDGSLELPDFIDPPDDPIVLLRQWVDAVIAADVVEPKAMVLATAGQDSIPSSRVVLVKTIDEHGIRFGTHSFSRKGIEMSENPLAAGTFYWRETMQQINLAGRVQMLSGEESDALFARRTDRSKAATSASRQSEPLDSAEQFHQRVDEILEAGDLARPEGWSGYRLNIERIEFWHGSTDRLHRRLEYSLGDGVWTAQRLQP